MDPEAEGDDEQEAEAAVDPEAEGDAEQEAAGPAADKSSMEWVGELIRSGPPTFVIECSQIRTWRIKSYQSKH